MYGFFVNENTIPFAALLTLGMKTMETRNRDMLKALVGERVAVISTRRGRKPWIVGYVTITGKHFCDHDEFDQYYNQHFVEPGSKYAPKPGRGKWLYFVEDADRCYPKDLPENAIRHGRAWCEF